MIACECEKIHYWQTHENMNAYREIEIISSTAKLVDASKYNLRCNRNISEKMTKKDFIYDIRTPAQTMRKVTFHKDSRDSVSDNFDFRIESEKFKFIQILMLLYRVISKISKYLRTNSRTILKACIFRRVKMTQNEMTNLQVEMQKRSIILPIQLRRKQSIDSKMPQYTVIPEKMERDGSGDATLVSTEIIYKGNPRKIFELHCTVAKKDI